MSTPELPPDPDAHIIDQDQYLKVKQERAKDVDFGDGPSAEQQAAERYAFDIVGLEAYGHIVDTLAPHGHRIIGTMMRTDVIVPMMNKAYAAALTERAIPAEEALRLAMELGDAMAKAATDLLDGAPIQTPRMNLATAVGKWDALRANPLAAKMLEE